MTAQPKKACLCAVCAREDLNRSNWFVVSEDRWLDQLSIFSWDACVAGQPQTQSVCGEKHLRSLLIHWLLRANLDFSGERNTRLAIGASEILPCEGQGEGGKLLGVLTVHRELAESMWSGSASAMECILRVVVHGFASEFQQLRPKRLEPASTEAILPSPDLAADHFYSYPVRSSVHRPPAMAEGASMSSNLAS